MSHREDILFDDMFKLMLNAMRLNLSHPDVPRDWKWAFKFSIAHGLFFTTFCFLVYSTIFHDLKNGDIIQACSNGTLCIVFNVITMKYIVLVWYQSRFRWIIEKIKSDYVTAMQLPPEEYEIVLLYAKKGRKIVILWFRICICAASLFPVKSVVPMIYYTCIGEFRLVPLYVLTYPDIIEQRKNELCMFLAIYALFLFFDAYAALMYLAFSPIGPVFILHACGQLELIKRRILKTFSRSRQDAIESLKRAAKHLTEIYEFVENLNICLKIYHELVFKAFILLVPVTIYEIIEAAKDGKLSFEFITLIVGALALCNIPCYFSDMMMDKSEEVRLALYSCGWESQYDKQARRLILLLLIRVTRPVAMKSMFRNICLDSLTDLYQQSYALFNLLNAIWH